MDPGKLALAVFNLMLVALAILHEICKGLATWKSTTKEPKANEEHKGSQKGQLSLQKEGEGKEGIEQDAEEGKEEVRKQETIRRARELADLLNGASEPGTSSVEGGEDGAAIAASGAIDADGSGVGKGKDGAAGPSVASGAVEAEGAQRASVASGAIEVMRADASGGEKGEDGATGASLTSGVVEVMPADGSGGEKRAKERTTMETKKPVELSDLLKTFEVRAKGKAFFIWHMIAMLGMLALGAAFVAESSDSIKERAQVVTGTTVNIEGTALANVYYQSSDEWKVWDPTDVAEPALEHTVFFVATKRVMTKNQTLKNDCLQSDVRCNNSIYCLSKRGERFSDSKGNGIFTGSCNDGYCSVRTWCPLEYNINDTAAHVETLNSPLNFDILIKSHLAVRYEYGPPFTRESVAKYEGDDAEHCLYDEKNDPHCPRFKLSYIVDKVTENNNDKYETLINNGGVISIRVDWRCRDTLDKCDLTYNFKRLDEQDSMFKKSYSYTDAEYLYGTDVRAFIRSTGIHFIIQVDGSATQFSFIAFIIFTVSAIGIIKSSKPVVEFFYLIYLKLDRVCCSGRMFKLCYFFWFFFIVGLIIVLSVGIPFIMDGFSQEINS